MVWLRKAVVYLLSVVLLLALLGAALATSVDSTFSHPDKVENWLSQSDIYSHFVAQVADQAQKSTGGNNSSVALTDVAVQQAAKSAFNTQLLQQDVNTFLNSNYAWLQGKSSTPNFSINLGPAKQTFAKSVGTYVATYLNSLPVCTPAQLVQLGNNIQNTDPLSLSCRPATINPQTEGTQITQQLASSSSFLSDPTLTANNIKSIQSSQSQQPYYQKFSKAPKLYRAAVHLPIILLVVALLSALGIAFIAMTRRHGARRIGEMLAIAGILLVLVKFAADKVFTQVEKQIFNHSNIGQLQQSLTDFAHYAEHQLVKVDLWFGIGFLLLALIIFCYLFITRQRQPKRPKPEKLPMPTNQEASAPSAASDSRRSPLPPRSKPPRLVQ